jgi:hypothetical protein
MAEDKEAEKGLMHSFFGGHLCEGCKGLLIVAYVAPTQRDVTSFAEVFANRQKQADEEGARLAEGAKPKQAAPMPTTRGWQDSPGADRVRAPGVDQSQPYK